MPAPSTIVLSATDRNALEQLAQRGADDRAALRARAVMALEGGEPVSAVARRLRLARATVRAARRRFETGGADALLDSGGPPQQPALRISVPEALFERAGAAGTTGRGRPPMARLRIECYVRDCAALGLFKRGGALPPRRWFARRFGTGPSAVQAAFDSLRAQGFAVDGPGGRTLLPQTLPFDGRYLLLIPSPPEEPDGIDAALIAAARRLESSLGIRWEIARVLPARDDPAPPQIREVASQRYAGVFMRTQNASRYTQLDNVPIGCIHIQGRHGSHVCKLANTPYASEHTLRTLFADCRSAGCRAPLVIDTSYSPRLVETETEAARETLARRLASEVGLTIAPDGYQTVFARQPRQMRRTIRMALAGGPFDAVVSLEDNFAPPICEALVEFFGSAEVSAQRVKVFSAGSFPVTLETALPVSWHGDDVESTLLSFVRWCNAIHAGDGNPPQPAIVRR